MRLFFFLCALGGASHTALAQYYSYNAVFPTLTGQTLFDSVVQRYKPTSVYSYNDARDTLYGVIYKVGDSLECVYSGHKHYLPAGVDPSAYVGDGGGANGINAEHSYPQSMGASTGNARSDMHHLMPSRGAVNTARSNLPYGEIADNQVNSWYYRDQVATSMPAVSVRGLYAKLRNNIMFEPREQHKGNAARAVFYFYTMYRAEALSADPTGAFFASQRPTLCQWHVQDPTDSAEWARTFKIARYQNNRPNPFILDCTLAKRMYCNTEITAPCTPSPVTHIESMGVFNLSSFPNPTTADTKIYFELERTAHVRLTIVNAWGQEVAVLNNQDLLAGDQFFTWNAFDVPAGLYFCRVQIGEHSVVNKILVAK